MVSAAERVMEVKLNIVRMSEALMKSTECVVRAVEALMKTTESKEALMKRL